MAVQQPQLPATHTAVIVAVPEAEAVVAEHRRRFDQSAAWGVPAHVTVLFPFVAPADLDDAVFARLSDALAAVPAFGCVFARCRWFEQEVLWLAPEPDAPLRALTEAVCRAFPMHLPYGGKHHDVVPHLTVGERRMGSLSALRVAESAVLARLPVHSSVDRVLLIAGAEAAGSWRTLREIPLRQQ